MICSPDGVLGLSEDKTVHYRLLSNLKVRSNLQHSVVTPTKWTERPSKASCHLLYVGSVAAIKVWQHSPNLDIGQPTC